MSSITILEWKYFFYRVQFDHIAWRRLAVCNRNFAMHIGIDHIVRQTVALYITKSSFVSSCCFQKPGSLDSIAVLDWNFQENRAGFQTFSPFYNITFNSCSLIPYKIGVVVTREFIDYISTRPLQVEVFGHYQHHPQHQSTAQLPRFGQGQITLSTSAQVMRIQSLIF